jgi:amidase
MAALADYGRYDAIGLAELVRTRQATPADLVEAAIERVETLNPKLNAVVHKMYDEARRRVAAGLPSGPFTGVPYLLKDLGQLYAGEPLSNGSHLFDGFVPDHDGTMTQRLKAAGLVILGKTSTPEMGLASTTEPRRFGPCRNPWDLSRSTGGSSGGSAAMVAAGALPAAHATDGGGSIRIPAAHCGLFGLKPTRIRTPMGPDISESMSGFGIGHAVTRTVRDSAALLDATHGPEVGDPYSCPPPLRPFLDEVTADPGRLRIAVSTRAPAGTPVDPECVRGVEDAAKLCAELGHTVEEAAPEFSAEAAIACWRAIAAAHVRNNIEMRLAALGRPLRQGDVETVTQLWAEEGARLTGAQYARATLMQQAITRSFGRFFQTHDILLTPTMADPPQPLGTYDMMSSDLDDYISRSLAHTAFTPQFNIVGCPAMSVPLHWTAAGLPVGVHFGAGFGNEAVLFRLAGQLERARPWRDRHPPTHI